MNNHHQNNYFNLNFIRSHLMTNFDLQIHDAITFLNLYFQIHHPLRNSCFILIIKYLMYRHKKISYHQTIVHNLDLSFVYEVYYFVMSVFLFFY
jgi:hypothetical protein